MTVRVVAILIPLTAASCGLQPVAAEPSGPLPPGWHLDEAADQPSEACR